MHEESVPADIVGYVADFVTRAMQPLPVSGVAVAAAPDHDGDPILLIDVNYGGTAEAVDPKAIARLVTRLRSGLWAKGERRFPYIRHHFSDQQKVRGVH